MGKKILDTTLDGCLRLEEETLSDGSKVFNVTISGDYSLPADDQAQAESIFLVVSRMLRK